MSFWPTLQLASVLQHASRKKIWTFTPTFLARRRQARNLGKPQLLSQHRDLASRASIGRTRPPEHCTALLRTCRFGSRRPLNERRRDSPAATCASSHQNRRRATNLSKTWPPSSRRWTARLLTTTAAPHQHRAPSPATPASSREGRTRLEYLPLYMRTTARGPSHG